MRKSSKPVSANTSFGKVKLKIGSIIAIFGNKQSPLIPDLKFFTSVIIAPFETSDPVPEVVGIATIGKYLPLEVIVFPIKFSIDVKFLPTAIAFAASIASPPKPITKSIFSFKIETASFTSFDFASGDILS